MIKNFVLLTLVLTVMSGCYEPTHLKKGMTAPSFEAIDFNGNAFQLEQLKGKYVLLSFWGSWCGPCLDENPALRQLNETFKDVTFKDATGFEIVSIGVERKEKKWRRSIEKYKLEWPHHISSLKRFEDPIVLQYGIEEIPQKFLLGPDQKIIAINVPIDVVSAYLKGQQ